MKPRINTPDRIKQREETASAQKGNSYTWAFREATIVRTTVFIAMKKKRMPETTTVDFFCKFIPALTIVAAVSRLKKMF